MQVAADQERAAKKASAAQEREANRAAQAAVKAGLASEKAWNKAAQAAEKAAEKTAQATKRAEEKRWAEVEKTSHKIIAQMAREAEAAERNAQKVAAATDKTRSQVMSRGLSMAGGALGMVAGRVLGVTEDVIGRSARGAMETAAIANRVSINARMPGQEAVDPNQLRKEFEATAISTPGISAQDIGRAAQAYVDLTGDLNTARGSMQTFATVASATGATVEDVATAAASFGKHFGVKTQDDVKQVFAILTAQGKGGAMTMHDMAAQMQRLAAAGKAFGIGTGVEGVAKLGGLLQVARSATGSPRMATTAVENMLRQMDAKSAKLGIKQYDKSGKKLDAYENLAQVIAKEGGSDIGAKHAGVNKFMGAQGARGTNPLVTAYEDAARGKSGADAQKAGHDAVVKALQDASKTATSWAEVEQDAAQAQKDASAQLTGAWSKLEAAAGEKLAPALTSLAGQLADGKVMDGFIAAIKIAATALEAFGAFAQRMGWIKGGSASEKSDAAAKTEADTRKKMAALAGEKGERLASLTPEQREQYNALKGVADAAGEVKAVEADTAASAGFGMHRIKTAAKWRGKGGGEEATEQEYRRLGGGWAMSVPVLGHSDFFQGISGETPEQRDVRHAGEDKQKEIFRQNTGQGAGSDKLDKSADSHERAAAKLSAASEKLAVVADKLSKLPSGPVVPGAK